MAQLFRCSACDSRAEELYRDMIEVTVPRECDDYDCEEYREDCTKCFSKECADYICEEFNHNCDVCYVYNTTESRYLWGFGCEECGKVTEVVTEIDRW